MSLTEALAALVIQEIKRARSSTQDDYVLAGPA